jgi:hypothetical protein
VPLKIPTLAAVIVVAIFAAAHARVEKLPAKLPDDTPPVFYRDLLPILQQHCQGCHRAGEIAPMPIVTYDDVRSRANEIAAAVSQTILRSHPTKFRKSSPGPIRKPRQAIRKTRRLHVRGSKAGIFRNLT